MVHLRSSTSLPPSRRPRAGLPTLASPEGGSAVEDMVAAGVLLDVTRVLGGLLALALERSWEFEVAARLSQIGWLTVPTETHDAALRGDTLHEDDWRAVVSHPLVARDLLSDVRRLDGVREMIARQREPCAVAGERPVPFSRRDRATQGGDRCSTSARTT